MDSLERKKNKMEANLSERVKHELDGFTFKPKILLKSKESIPKRKNIGNHLYELGKNSLIKKKENRENFFKNEEQSFNRSQKMLDKSRIILLNKSTNDFGKSIERFKKSKKKENESFSPVGNKIYSDKNFLRIKRFNLIIFMLLFRKKK